MGRYGPRALTQKRTSSLATNTGSANAVAMLLVRIAAHAHKSIGMSHRGMDVRLVSVTKLEQRMHFVT